MIYFLLAVAVIVSFVLGYAFSRLRQGSTVPADQLNAAIAEKAVLSERLRSADEDRARLMSQTGADSVKILELGKRISGLEATQQNLELRTTELVRERAQLVSHLEIARKLEMDLNSKLASALSTTKSQDERIKAQHDYVEELKKQTKVEFENLAQKVLDLKSKTFSEQTEKSIENLLKPLREKLGTFEQKVEATYKTEANERLVLKTEVERLIQLNERMTKETNSLTQALKGDSKFQGDWGELVLEKILEASGLTEGREYTTQKSHTDDDGSRYKPDVVIQLPEGKHVIVDSKVSLTAFEQHRRVEDETARSQALDAHLKSIEKHINDLSDKHYARLKGVNSPEFVFMFVPVEPAYLIAMQADSDLSHRAWKKGIVLVTATTLLASLKTVAHIWRLENQNKNAQEIANEGAKLYDKFVGLLEDLEKIGKLFDTGSGLYQNAMGKLKEGPGNVFRRMEILRELGAGPTKRIKQELLE